MITHRINFSESRRRLLNHHENLLRLVIRQCRWLTLVGLFVAALYSSQRPPHSLERASSSSSSILSSRTSPTSSTTATSTRPASLLQPPTDSCLTSAAVKPFLSQTDAQEIVANYFRNLSPSDAKFDVGHALVHLLQEATRQDKLLLTLQIGGMDGKSNDPMYAAMVDQNVDQISLSHWMPIVIEPVLSNVLALRETYRDHETKRGLQCRHLAHWAVAYGKDVGPDHSCTFHRFNDAPDAPKECQGRPDWQRKQVGTLSENGSKSLFGQKTYDLCIVKDKVSCGSIADLFASLGLEGGLEQVAMLQIDIEGYEAIVLPALFRETDQQQIRMPPLVNYESKVVLAYDKHRKTQDLENIRNAFRQRGYQVYASGEQVSGKGADDVAIYGAQAPTNVEAVPWYTAPVKSTTLRK